MCHCHLRIIIPQFENMVAADVQKTVDDKFMSALTAEVNKIGQTRFVRFKNEVFSAAFVDHAKALDAVKVGLMKVCSEITEYILQTTGDNTLKLLLLKFVH